MSQLILVNAAIKLQPRNEDVIVHFMDAGQGLSVVIEHAGHWVIYDVGIGNQHRSFVKSQLLPFLSSKGVSQLSLLMISHGDIDHAGDVTTLVKSLPVVVSP